jgi:micrococcal nuclease
MFEYRAKIISVFDGDTCRADIDLGFGVVLKNQSLRVHGLDTPEIGSEAGYAARDFARALLPASLVVRIQTFKDAREKYGRYLAKISLPDATDFATAMIAAGHAVPYFGGAKQP